MSLEDREDRTISGTHELSKIPDPTVRVAARFVLEELHPNEEIVLGYETEFYKHGCDLAEGTRPDLHIQFPDRAGYLLEVTRSRKKYCIQSLETLPIWLGKTDVLFSESGGIELLTVLIERDPKGKQKRVMRNVAPNIDYGVWYGDDLAKIQQTHPGYEFFP